MVESAEFFRFYTRKCFIALERLDEKSLNKCLQEYGLKLSTQGGTQRPAIEPRINRQPNPKSNKPKRRRRKRSSLDDILGRNGRKRKKIKPLCYSDDENCDEKNKLTVFSELNDQKMLNESLDSLTVELKLKQEEGRSNKFSKKDDMISPESCVQEEKVQKEERKNTPVKSTIPQQDLDCSTADNRLVSDTEIEIIKICTVDEQMGGLTVSNNNNNNNNNKREFEDDGYDTREDDEDDRITIIFDQSQSREVLVENDAVRNKFKNRGITNRKKQKLVKFKRKSMAGRNLAKVERKSKIKSPDVPVGEQKRLEKTAENVSEESLIEVCCLVKRLHELSRMISMLQKELSTNGKLTLHFRKVINAEQENFHREIRKCQNTIIKCYEKMLSFYNDTSQVAFEIGKRTSLSVEDVVNVISLCIHIEGQCETEKSRNGGKQAVFPPAAPSDSLRKMITDNLVRTISQRENNAEKQQAVRSSSGVRLSPPKRQTSTNCSGVPPIQFDTLPRQQMVDRSIGAPVSQRNAILENFKSRMNYSALEPPAREKTLHSTVPPHGYNPIMPSYNLNIPRKYVTTARQPRNCPLASYYKDNVMVQLPQHVLCTINQRPSDTLSQQKSTGHQPTNLQTAQVGLSCQTVTPLHPVNLLAQKRNNSPEFSVERNNPSLTFRILVPANGLPPIKLLENSKHTSTTFGSNSRSGGFPSAKTHNNHFEANPPQLIPSNEIHHPIGSNFSASIRVLDNSRLFVNPAEFSIRDCKVTVATDSANALQEVLDPTIPQKLTMRNSRLQAGPVLNLEADKKVYKSTTTTDESIGERTVCNLDQEDSESRVYVCAQNECENPGVRICKGCHSVIYCSESCQSKHWMLKHKTECYQLKELRG